MRHLRKLIGMAVVTGLVALLILYPERLWLESQVVPQPGTTLTFWIDGFMEAAFNIGLYVSAGAVVLWYVVAQFRLSVVRFRQGRRRGWWFVIGLVAVIICFAAGWMLTERTRAGGQGAWIFYVLNPLLLYYTATALFSPDAFKYTVPGAQTLHFWR